MQDGLGALNMKVFLIDDHPVLRGGLRELMAKEASMSVVGEASTGAAALERVGEALPDIVVMDVHLPDMSGIEVARHLLKILPMVMIVMFSCDADRTTVDEALQAGACGYVWKQSDAEELFRAMQTVMAGKLFLSQEVSVGILEDYRNTLLGGKPNEEATVTDRERELIRLICEGRRNKEIAAQLKVSPKSTEAYRSRLMKKLGYASTAELVRYAIREGIVSA